MPKILPSIAAALCVLGSLTSAAHGANINGQANYIYFKVPGGGDTCPTAINASMTTTGYYLVTYNEAHGFIRTADGTIDTFVVPGAVWTQPESINAAGDVTGFYELSTDPANYQVHGFLRYADGRIITVDPPPQGGNSYAGYPVSINDFDEVAGTLYTSAPSAYGFTRSRGGVYGALISFGNSTVATAINASGSVVGYGDSFAPGELIVGFVTHPDGYHFTFTVSVPPSGACPTTAATMPADINAGGAVAGWYLNTCPTSATGGFVMAPGGQMSIFQLPGMIEENYIKINEVGDVTGAYMDPGGVQHGFVRNPYGTVTSFDPPEGSQDATIFTQPTGITDTGVISGFFSRDGYTGFIRIPL